ncbi:serine/threonine-protein kinase [Streptomyces sp. NPDC058442]|uniref:serine/threonine-protein kinase n=1 Tax=Streptomyces sp. NPDC058442 TaxID=3346503 RepID=UPI0036650EAE
MKPLDTNADPRVVGPFELLARLGAGGMGVAYLAREIPLEGLSGEMVAAYRLVEPDHDRGRDEVADPSRLVVVKMIQPSLLGQPQARERFAREIDAVRAVAGDRVPALRAADPEAGEPWFAMDYIAGPSLHTLVKGAGPLPVGPCAALGLALVDALAAIHGTKLLHRDLKPSNVVLGPNGPVVLDFGLAVLAERQSSQALTRTGDRLGTRPYMPVEQLRDSKHVEAPADVYALGATLFFALTGRAPYPYMPLMVPPTWEGVDPAFLPLLGRVIVAEPLRRPDLDGVRESLSTLLTDAGLTPEQAAEQLRERVTDADLTPKLPPEALKGRADPVVRELAQKAVDEGEAPDAPWAEDDPGFYGLVNTEDIEWVVEGADGPGGHPPTLLDDGRGRASTAPTVPLPASARRPADEPAGTGLPLPPPRPGEASTVPAVPAGPADTAQKIAAHPG